MVGESQTKLFKLVCKQVALMREPYRNSRWTTNQINQTNKKVPSVHKMKQRSQSDNTVKRIVRQTSSSIKKVCMIEEYIFLYIKHLLIDYYCSISFT
jgi:hypothetical protein